MAGPTDLHLDQVTILQEEGQDVKSGVRCQMYEPLDDDDGDDDDAALLQQLDAGQDSDWARPKEETKNLFQMLPGCC